MNDMTKGKPWKVLLLFALPMILSGLIQQLYSLADSVIVGNFASYAGGGISGEDALAAVGVSMHIIHLFIALGNGGGMGCGVVIAQLFGAKRTKDVKSSIYTALISFGVFSIVVFVLGAILAAPMTRLMNTPENIYAPAVEYLQIYMYGLPFLFIYNVCNSIFNALGDSKKPLYFLIFSSVLNVVLDYIFVKYLGLAVKGVAWATFIAQGLACMLSLLVLLRKIRAIECKEPVPLFNTASLKNMLRVSLPSMLQMSIVSVGGLFVQRLANSFGSSFIAGYSSAVRIQGFYMIGINVMGSAISTFCAQNIGAQKLDRPIQGVKAGLSFQLIYSVVMLGLVTLFGEWMINMFVDAPSGEVVAAGMNYLRINVCGLGVFSIFNAFNGLSRGAGYMKAFTMTTLLDLVVRVVCAYTLVGVLGSDCIVYSVLIGWAVGCVVAILFYRTGKWKTIHAI